MPRNTLTRSHLIAGTGLVLAGAAQAGTTDVLWDLESAPGGGNSSTSMVFPTPFAEDTEVADDFNVTGQIEQLSWAATGAGSAGRWSSTACSCASMSGRTPGRASDADGDGDTDSNDLNTVLGAFGV